MPVASTRFGIETPIQRQARRLAVPAGAGRLGLPCAGGAREQASTRTPRPRGCSRSQLRTKSDLKVIDTDVRLARRRGRQASQAAGTPIAVDAAAIAAGEARIKDDKDLQAYEDIFADAAYWKKIGDEYQSPLIVTGIGPVHRVGQERHGLQAAGNVRLDGPAGSYEEVAAVRRPQGLRPDAEVRVHRRPDRRAALLGVVPGRGALPRQPEHPGAVVLFRADGQAAAGVPEHPEHPEDPGHPDPAASSTDAWFAETRRASPA